MKPINKMHIKIISVRRGAFHHKSQWQKETIQKVKGGKKILS